MEAEIEEECFTLTSFAPLSPEDENSGLRKFFKGLKATVGSKSSHDNQSSQVNSASNSPQVSYVNSDTTRNKQLSKKNPVVEGLYSKDEGSQNNCTLQDRNQSKIVADRHSRTPGSVLRRLSQLVLLQEKSYPQQTQGTDNLKKYWMPDEQCKVCYECGLKFHTFRRRHHCRLCGQIFCSRCCNEVVSGHQIGYTGVFRVCIYCKKIVLTYTSSSDVDKNLKQLKEDLRLVGQPDSTNPAINIHGWNALFDDPELHRSFDVLGVSAEEANLLKQDSFKDLWKQITTPRTGLEFMTHRIRLRTYSTCFVGRDLIDWLMVNRKAPNRAVAVQICQGLLDLGWIEPLNVTDPDFSDDFMLYIPGPRASGDIYHPYSRSFSQASQENEVGRGKQEPISWLSTSFDQSVSEARREQGFHKSNSTSKIVPQDLYTSPSRIRSLSCESFAVVKTSSISKDNPQCDHEEHAPECPKTQSPSLDVFVNIEDCYVPRRMVPEEASEGTGAENDNPDESKQNDRITAKDLKLSLSMGHEEHEALQKLSDIHDKHISAFLVQLLDQVGLSQSWKDIIESLAIKVCEMVIPDIQNEGDMDIRHYVKIKKIPGGSRSECRIVSGVVCTKNVVHKKMATAITQPQILMLACPVEFQRVENKMSSLDSLLLQEQEFLKNMVGRILSLKPGLVLAEKTVSRLAQNMLLARGISVMINIKSELMSRISHCVKGDVLLSLDQGSRPRLGTCQKFKIEKFVFENGSTKTLAFFEGCSPTLGATIVLRGASRKELAKVRDVLRFTVLIVYNSRLEKSFIMDEFGTPFVQETDSDQAADELRDKVKFSVEGSMASDDENTNSAEHCSESKDCLALRDNHKSSTEANPICSERNVEENTAATTSNELISNTENNPVSCSEESGESPSGIVTSESFQQILDKILLSSSPLVRYPLPYLLTPEGKHCELRKFMSGDIYWSPLFFGESSADRSSSEDEVDSSEGTSRNELVFIKQTHPFVHTVLGKDAVDMKVLELLASFRAEGGRVSLKKQDRNCAMCNGMDNMDGTKGSKSVHKRPSGDAFVAPDDAEGTEGDQSKEQLTLVRDCFDPFLHQMIAVMFSSYSSDSGNFPNPCIAPWTVFMEFYARNDLTLGCFLERYCFRPSYVCPNPNCDVPMVKHVRYFAHGDGAVYINMKNLESPIPGFSKTLLTWSWCKQCKQVTPMVPVSTAAWRLSFAKYLELRIYATCYRRRSTEAPCDHSLHRDHHQYFAFNNIVASLKYVPCNIYEVHLAPSIITIIKEERQPQFWIKHIQAMSARVYQLINLISDRIAALKTEAHISDCVADIQHDKGQLDEKIKVLDSKAMLLLTPPSSPGESTEGHLLEPHEISAVEYEILDGITLLKKMMCEYGEKWNTQLVELLQLENEKKKMKTMEAKNSNSTQNPIETSQMTDDSIFSNSNVASPLENTGSRSSIQVNPFAIENIPSIPENTLSNPADKQPSEDNDRQHAHGGSPEFSDSNAISEQGSLDDNSLYEDEPSVDLSIGQRGLCSSSTQKFEKHSKLWATLTEEVSSTIKDVQYVEDRPGPKMKRIISQFLPGVSFRSIPSPFPVHEHHLLPVSGEIPVVVNEREPTSIIAYTLSSPAYQARLQKIQESLENDSDSFTYIDTETEGVPEQSDGRRTRTRTRSEAETLSSSNLMNALDDDFVENYFQWSELEDEETGIEDTAEKPERNNPGLSGDDKISKVVQDDARIPKEQVQERGSERTDKGFENNTKQSRVEFGNSTETDASLSDSVKSNMDEKDSLPSSSTEDVEYHIKHSFSDSSAKFFCIVYFGEQFRRIREAVFPDGEEKYIRSLQYCLKWQVTGGKSGSSFCKTTDDRFVVKGMSRPEAQSFLNIAPYYFQYMEKAIEEKRPTLLAKILGVYRIGCNSKLTNTPVREDLLVMDNLFYNCKVDQIFDLKGSVRSRYVQMSRSEKENNVLLDENLLELIAESPLFIRPHSKGILSRAINSDTEFLARHMVMDYSLLLGIERNSCRLIMGIIDFIRTFTWDKKLEMYVKSTGILGGQGKMPTVVSPELYRERFCEAMQRYFLMIPNKWTGLGNELK